MSSKVQSVLLSRSKFKNVKSAKAYAKRHGFKSGKVDVTENYYRFRQLNPKGSYRYRTISKKQGAMKLVVVYPKGSKVRRTRRTKRARRTRQSRRTRR